MALFRRKTNKAVSALFQARRNNKSVYNIDGHGLGMFDFVGAKKQIAAKDKLKLEMQKRKKGIVGLARKSFNPSAMTRLDRLKKFQLTAAERAKKPRKIPLHNLHPLLKGYSIGDVVTTTSKRGNILKGRILDANSERLALQVADKEVVLILNKLATIK